MFFRGLSYLLSFFFRLPLPPCFSSRHHHASPHPITILPSSSQVATQTAATDPRTGTIDMDMITTGHSALDRGQLAALKVS